MTVRELIAQLQTVSDINKEVKIWIDDNGIWMLANIKDITNSQYIVSIMPNIYVPK